jgi:hypothetical protein
VFKNQVHATKHDDNIPFVSSDFFNDLTRQWREEAEVNRFITIFAIDAYWPRPHPVSHVSQARPVEKLSNQDIFDASEFVSKNTATLEYAHLFRLPAADASVTLRDRYFRAFRRMDKTKPIFPNYVTKKQPTGVPWDNKFRSVP